MNPFGIVGIRIILVPDPCSDCGGSRLVPWGWNAAPDLIVLLMAALFPAFWVLLLMQHIVYHAPFMVRMLVVFISLPPLALIWPRGDHRAGRGENSPFQRAQVGSGG